MGITDYYTSFDTNIWGIQESEAKLRTIVDFIISEMNKGYK